MVFLSFDSNADVDSMWQHLSISHRLSFLSLACLFVKFEADVCLGLEQVVVVRLMPVASAGESEFSEEGQTFPFLDLGVAADSQHAAIVRVDENLRLFAFLGKAVLLLDLARILLPALSLLDQRRGLGLVLFLECFFDLGVVEWQLLSLIFLELDCKFL